MWITTRNLDVVLCCHVDNVCISEKSWEIYIELTFVSSWTSEPLMGLARAAACSSDSSLSCSPPITGSLPAAPSSLVIPTLFAAFGAFDLDFETMTWLPQVATTPFSVLVVVPDEIIALVVTAAGETHGMWPVSLLLWLVLGGWERALVIDPPVLHEHMSRCHRLRKATYQERALIIDPPGFTWVCEHAPSSKERNVPIGVLSRWGLLFMDVPSIWQIQTINQNFDLTYHVDCCIVLTPPSCQWPPYPVRPLSWYYCSYRLGTHLGMNGPFWGQMVSVAKTCRRSALQLACLQRQIFCPHRSHVDMELHPHPHPSHHQQKTQ